MAFDPWSNDFVIAYGDDEEPVTADSLRMTGDEFDFRFGTLNRKEFARELSKRLSEINRSNHR